MKQHDYTSDIAWTGNRGDGTKSYRSYDRTWDIAIPGKPVVHCSNDPLLGGNPARANPEDLLLSSLAACHMLWYLHYASEAGIVASYMTHGGLIDGCRTSTGANIANCGLKGTAFGSGGAPYQFAYGTYVNPTGNMIAPPGSDYVNY